MPSVVGTVKVACPFGLIVTIAGLAGVAVFGHSALVDSAALKPAYAHYEQAVRAGADLKSLFVAESAQGIYRLNLFADGVWALLSAILAAVGMIGCGVPAK